jgi:beta-mannosidase
MKRVLTVVTLLIFSVLTGNIVLCQTVKFDLKKSKWFLRDGNDSIFIKDANPSDVFLALYEKGIIDDPYYGSNEEKLQWVGKRKWIYYTKFDLPSGILSYDNVKVVFEGLDTYAAVFLNGKKILSADNMFRKWESDVKGILKPEKNILKVIFYSPEKMNIRKEREAGYSLPDVRGFTRKAAYQSGWDWGPRFVTMGIWKPLYLQATRNAEISGLYVEQVSVSEKRAKLFVKSEIESYKNGEFEVATFINGKLFDKNRVELKEGDNSFSLEVVLENPALWWPNGMGKQNLYSFEQQVLKEGKTVDVKRVVTGLRKVELVTEKDSAGSSFYFKINGKRVFARGANFIPMDNFPSRIGNDRYRELLSVAHQSNFNMLRVWGGGYYENDVFYRLCDSLGIMVWQDFMFACNMVPVDSSFADNVKEETAYQIKRLRNHPSIVLWCGNNEVDEAWHNWGWQKQMGYSVEDSAMLWNAYLNIFNKIVPGNIAALNPEIPYRPSSPSIGWGHQEAFRNGDVHYWEVWWGKKPFEYYEKKIGRFMSEYGFQGMPSVKSIKRFCPDTSRYLYSKCMKTHQKHPFGRENIRLYMERDYKIPTKFEDYVYVSQLLQAEGISKAVEAHRRAKPYCMGTLYWQFNDCWPVTSWSSVDYYNNWKALQYTIKHNYAAYLVSFEKINGNTTGIWIVSDTTENIKALLKWKLINFKGKVLDSGIKELNIPADTLWQAVLFNNKYISDSSKTLLEADIEAGGKIIAHNLFYFTKPKYLDLPKSKIDITITGADGYFKIALTSEKLVKNILLSATYEGFFSDNYFDLPPGETKTVRFYTKEKTFGERDLKVKSLCDTYAE